METPPDTTGTGPKSRFVLSHKSKFALGAVLAVALLGSLAWILFGWPLPTQLWIALVIAAGFSCFGITALFIKDLPHPVTQALTAGTGLMVLIAAFMEVQGTGGPGTSTGGQVAPVTSGPVESPRSATERPAFPEDLKAGLLTPHDLSNLMGLIALNEQSGTKLDVKSSGPTPFITYVSGDSACKDVVNVHPIADEAWAEIYMGEKPIAPQTIVEEDIESFANLAEAKQVMMQNREQVANCFSFVGDYGDPPVRMEFSHKEISVPPLGDDVIAHQIDGEAEDGTWITWNIVEIRYGMDIIFIYYGPAERKVADTAAIASAAWNKYSTVR